MLHAKSRGIPIAKKQDYVNVTELYGKHKDQDIYIIGTGPSLRVFPLDYLKDKLTIGLNQAWRHGHWTYMLTVHGELYLDWEKRQKTNKLKVGQKYWIVSAFKPPLLATRHDSRWWVFASKNSLEALDNPQFPGCLVVLHGIQNTALHLAYHMGARNIFLIGVDMGKLSGDYHAHEQHVKMHGRPEDEVYRDMRSTTAAVRGWLKKKGINVFNLTSLLGGSPEEDYKRLCSDAGLEPLPKPEDTSNYCWYKGDQPKL